ncbi:MAG TPA: SagB/ThcOx family dehydrogenase [Gemmatimonadales bacterium]|nr:SagB/ThcOx family dehydrogenase [Gemmatimonadales bacterium]
MSRLAAGASLLLLGALAQAAGQQPGPPVTALPTPAANGPVSVEQALLRRRSVREYTTHDLTEAEVSQLLWAAQGVTHPDGLRTAPSAGALYPLELYVATRAGLHHYEPRGHRLLRSSQADLRPALSRAAHGQAAVANAPAVFIITAAPARTAAKYGVERGARYVQLEAGHAAQNLLLEAVALGLAGVPVGAFDDAEILRTLRSARGVVPLYLIPVGHPRR